MSGKAPTIVFLHGRLPCESLKPKKPTTREKEKQLGGEKLYLKKEW